MSKINGAILYDGNSAHYVGLFALYILKVNLMIEGKMIIKDEPSSVTPICVPMNQDDDKDEVSTTTRFTAEVHVLSWRRFSTFSLLSYMTGLYIRLAIISVSTN